MVLNSCNLWKLIVFAPYFPFHSKHSGRTVNTHLLFSHSSYSLTANIGLNFFSIQYTVYHIKNFQEHAQILFNIRLKPFLPKSAASFFIWYPNFPCYLFSVCDTDIKQTARRIVWDEMWGSIRQAAFSSLLQAIHTSCRQLYALCAHFSLMGRERSLARHVSVMY